MEQEKKKVSVDWATVEQDYRTGLMSDRALGSKHGVSHTAIQKKAKLEGWSKDLSARIRQKAEDKVAKDEVAKEVATGAAATERQVIDANAEMIANVMRGHRSDLGRLRSVVTILLIKIEAILTEGALFQQLGEVKFEPNEQGYDKVNELYHKVIALPGQTDATKKLAETLKLLIELERKVFKLDVQEDPIEAAARGAAEGAAKGMGEFSRSALADLISELDNEAPGA